VKALVWSGLIAAVMLTGIVYFPREYPELKLWEAIYVTLELFVVQRDMETFPQSLPLIVIYFAAPAITLSAVGAAISYLFRLTPLLRTRWMSDHVVICGVGRTGKLLAQALLERGVSAVGIDLGPPESFTEWLRDRQLPMLYGDFHSPALQKRAGAQRARALVFASGDDLANLEGAIAAYEWLQTPEGPVRIIWTHLSNQRRRSVARAAVRTEGRVGIRFFDTYRIAAVKMIGKYFTPSLRAGIREVNIIGFGKFGRDLLESLVADMGPGEDFIIRVVDRHDRKQTVMSLAADLGVPDRVSFTKAVVQEMELVDAADKAFFLCTDDDLGNLTAAMMMAAKGRVNCIYVRMARWPLAAMAERLGEDCGVVFVNINELVAQGLEELPGLFQPATEDDLKRVKGKMG
jgi:voltage-gated potassium channel Kch